MDARLDGDAKRIADRLSYGGWHTVSGRPFWESIEPFCVSRPGNPETIDHWHHGERGQENRLEYFVHHFWLD